MTGRQRIIIVGSGGAGKSTFARRIAALTGLPLIHLDREHWHPGWIETPKDEWRAKVEGLAARDRWIIDGNYGGTLALRVARADAIVFFDFPRWLCLLGVVKRRFRRGERPDMTAGCSERLDARFLRWVCTYNKVSRPKVVKALAAASPETTIITVTRRSDVHTPLKGWSHDAA